MWIVNQARPDIANAVRAMARFSQDPKPIHYKAAQRILEYLNATSDVGLTFRRDSHLGSVQLEVGNEAYVDAVHAHKAEGRGSVSGVAVSCGGALVSWFSRTQKCVNLSATEAEYAAMVARIKEALYAVSSVKISASGFPDESRWEGKFGRHHDVLLGRG